MADRVTASELEVVRHALTAAAEEMSLTVMRAARSPLLREAGDLSSAITDPDGELIAQGRDIPMHLGVLCFTVKEFLRRVDRDRLAEGDVWFLNLPEIGGNHLPDVKAIRPIFSGGRIVAFAVSLAHWADIGGALPGSYVPWATDVWQEGLRIPPVRLYADDEAVSEKIELVLANVRGRGDRYGDIQAQFAATWGAEKRIDEIADRVGADWLVEAMEALHGRAEAQMRDALEALPMGTFSGEDWLDSDGVGQEPISIRVEIERTARNITFDFSRTDDAAKGPINTTPFIVAASVYYALRAIFGPDIPATGRSYRMVDIVTRAGSVLQPDGDQPVVGGNHETSQRIVDAIIRALEDVVPDRLTAGSSTTSGLLLFSGRRADGMWTTLYETHGGGEGARADRPGMHAVRAHMSNVMNTPAEVIEAEYPIRVEYQELRRGSGGRGTHRGGDGQRRAYRVTGDEVWLVSMVERMRFAPYGLRGGSPGAPFRVTLHREGEPEVELDGKVSLRLACGDVIVLESSGGGGFGPKPDLSESGSGTITEANGSRE